MKSLLHICCIHYKEISVAIFCGNKICCCVYIPRVQLLSTEESNWVIAVYWWQQWYYKGLLVVGESGANWHPGRIGTPRVSAHVSVANLWRWCFYVAHIPTRKPRTYGGQTRLGLKIIMTNHFWITWVYYFNNSYFVFSS